jgi:two-component system nitrate/nitrite response regulator NarL
MKKSTNIIMVEDHPEYREIVEMALSRQDDMQLTDQFGTAERALQHLQIGRLDAKPDVILLDLNLPGMGGLEALEEIPKVAPDAKIIILTQSDQEDDVLNAIMLGASGYLLKSSTVGQIVEGIKLVKQGGASLDSRIARFVIDSLKTKLPHHELEQMLSEREIQVLELLADGLVKKQIALKLGIGVTTVVSHVGHIYNKLEASNAPSAIAKGFKLGILQVND